MAGRVSSHEHLEEKKIRSSSRSPARAPKTSNGRAKGTTVQAPKGFASQGVKDNDIFKLPKSDWELLAIITVIGSLVRLFRLSQPTSVVFDEVQYVTQ